MDQTTRYTIYCKIQCAAGIAHSSGKLIKPNQKIYEFQIKLSKSTYNAIY